MQREKEEALKKILLLEKELHAKQKLQLEIEELRGKLEVMKHLGNDDDAAVKRKMEEMTEELHQKMEDMNHLEEMNQTLVVKQRQSNDELQKARKVAIEVYLMNPAVTASQDIQNPANKCERCNLLPSFWITSQLSHSLSCCFLFLFDL